MVEKKNSALDNKDAIFPAAQKVEAEVKAQQAEKGVVSKACWFLLCSDASVGYGEAFKAQGDPPCPVLIRPNSAACSPA
jgi:hypothetical protein